MWSGVVGGARWSVVRLCGCGGCGQVVWVWWVWSGVVDGAWWCGEVMWVW